MSIPTKYTIKKEISSPGYAENRYVIKVAEKRRACRIRYMSVWECETSLGARWKRRRGCGIGFGL
jgi:hypothetical protein